MPFIPHTADDVQQMLKTIGAQNIEDLFDEIPESLRATPLKNIPEGLSEFEAAQLLQELATQNQNGDCFIGAGAYEHFIPAAVWELTSRGEFLTAYTPYQAEASQGTLTVIYEYQTMIASLTGMDAANASLYDGASALAEAVLMAVRANRKSKSRKILVPTNVNPDYCRTIKATVDNQNIELVMVPYCQYSGQFLLESLTPYSGEDITAVIIQQPNFFGQLEAVDELTNWAHQQQALVIASVNPTALALLKEPGQWGEQGADIVCGEGQPLGVPLASGGPYFGFMACKQVLVRQMPGRIVGRTVDADGQPGFTLTLQAREQHIRRGKATSNICTNQGLLVTAATIYMSLLGFTGLQHVAAKSHENTQLLLEKLTAIPGVELIFKSDGFHEVALRLALPVEQVLAALASKGIQGGYALTADYPELGNALLVCATETKTPAQLQRYADVLAEVMGSGDRKVQADATSSRGLTGFVV